MPEKGKRKSKTRSGKSPPGQALLQRLRLNATWRQRFQVVARWLVRRGIWYLPWVVIATVYARAHYWVCDDAYISFRYARNLVQGHGLVFNVGEYVEGYTNFLWTLEVAALYAVGISPATASTLISVLLTVGTFVLTALLARSTPVRAYAPFAAVAAFALLAINRNVAVWTTSGLETRQFTFLVILAVWLLHGWASHPRRLWTASVVFALAALTRPEGLLLWGVAGAWYVADRQLRGCERVLQGLEALVLPCLVICSAHFLWRHAYYGDWLPNTYYAKVGRPWLDAGFDYYTAAAIEGAWYLVVPLALLGTVLRWGQGRDSFALLVTFLLGAHTAYLIRLGGDHFELRPFDFYWPLLAVLVVDGVVATMLVVRVMARERRWLLPRALARAAGMTILLVFVLYSSVFQWAHVALTYNLQRYDKHVEFEVTPETFPFGFLLPGMQGLATLFNDANESLIPHAIAVRWREHFLFAQNMQESYGPYQRADRRRFPDGAIMNHMFMGHIPWALGEVTMIDTYGLTDRTVAREGEISIDNANRVMAHHRWPPPGYLESRGVNIEIWEAKTNLRDALDRAKYAVELAPGLWAPFDSPRPDWVEPAFVGYRWYHLDARAPERSVLAGQHVKRVTRLGDFERDSQWALMGSFVVTDQPGPEQHEVSGFGGQHWLTSYSQERDAGKGEAHSPTFTAHPGDHLFLKIAGGNVPGLGVSLVTADDTPRQLVTWPGPVDERFHLYVTDLTAYAGQKLRVDAIDQATEGWGHIMLDDVMVLGTQ